MKLVVFMLLLVLYIDINVNGKELKKSVRSEKGDPLTWLLLNQIKRIDSTLEKLQEGEKGLDKKLHEQEKQIIATAASIKIQITQLSNKITGGSGKNQVNDVKKTLASLQATAKTHLTASQLENVQKEINEIKVKVADHERQLKALKCPNGWKKWHESCYYFGKEQINWHEAKSKCKSIGGDLVKLETLEESRMLNTEANKLAELGVGCTSISTTYKATTLSKEEAINNYNSELETKDTSYSTTSASYLDLILEVDSLGGHCSRLYDKRDDFKFPIVNIPSAPAFYIGFVNSVWNGANDISREGTWQWVSDNSVAHFTHWNPGEPNSLGGNQDCAIMYLAHDFRWDDCGCGQCRGHYICEKYF